MPYADPERRREAGREAQRRYRKRNPEQNRESSRRWRQANPEKHRARVREYELRHRVPCPECGKLKRRRSRICNMCNHALQGDQAYSWKGGRTISHGYVLVRAPRGHPRTSTTGYIPEHVLVMESLLNRYLYPEERVHHINGKRDDNRFENLELWAHTHPSGQRVVDLLAWAKEIITRYN